jgi:hypothetical protein
MMSERSRVGNKATDGVKHMNEFELVEFRRYTIRGNQELDAGFTPLTEPSSESLSTTGVVRKHSGTGNPGIHTPAMVR